MTALLSWGTNGFVLSAPSPNTRHHEAGLVILPWMFSQSRQEGAWAWPLTKWPEWHSSTWALKKTRIQPKLSPNHWTKFSWGWKWWKSSKYKLPSLCSETSQFLFSENTLQSPPTYGIQFNVEGGGVGRVGEWGKVQDVVSLCIFGCSRTQRSACLCLQSTGIKGVHYHGQHNGFWYIIII